MRWGGGCGDRGDDLGHPGIESANSSQDVAHSQPTACPPRREPCYCSRCDLLVGLDGSTWSRSPSLVVESRGGEACRVCGVVANTKAAGGRQVATASLSAARNWCGAIDGRCCAAGGSRDARRAAARDDAGGWWAIGQGGAPPPAGARQLGTSWRTGGARSSRAGGDGREPSSKGWHPGATSAMARRADQGLTGMVDLTKQLDSTGKPRPRARLLDLAPPHRRQLTRWLKARTRRSAGIPVATLDPSTGTRTPSTTSSTTPSPCWTPSTRQARHRRG